MTNLSTSIKQFAALNRAPGADTAAEFMALGERFITWRSHAVWYSGRPWADSRSPRPHFNNLLML
jgi:hypothetical protein